MFSVLSGRFREHSLRALLVGLHRDDEGSQGVEKLLLIAAIVLPLLGVLIVFRDDISKWVEEKWGDIKGRGAEPQVNP
jgi:hypothetical protein